MINCLSVKKKIRKLPLKPGGRISIQSIFLKMLILIKKKCELGKQIFTPHIFLILYEEKFYANGDEWF